MRRAGLDREGGRVAEDLRASSPQREPNLGEAQVVARQETN